MIDLAYVGTRPCDHPRWSAVQFLKTLGLCKTACSNIARSCFVSKYDVKTKVLQDTWLSLGKPSKKNNGYFTVRLIVRFDPPPYGQLICVFFWGVHLTSVFDNTWFETNFVQKYVFWPFVWPFGCVKMSISNRSKHYNGTKNAMKGNALDMHF